MKGVYLVEMQTHKRRHKGVFILLLSLLALVSGFLVLTIKVNHDAETPFTVKIDASKPQRMNDYTANTILTKYWINNEGTASQNYGAQYDTTVRNNTDYDIINWKIEIDVPEEKDLQIDSYWNGSYKYQDGKLIFTAGDKVDPIPAGMDITFGAVIISDGIMKLDQYEFTGCKDKPITRYISFWLIMVLFIVWCTSVVAYILYRIREASYERNEEIKDSIISQSISTCANLIDAKDPYTKGHSTRVSYYTQKIAEKMGLHESEIKNLGYIALMHDCGKIGIPDNILTKPAKLTDEEFRIMQQHTLNGGKALEDFTSINGIVEGALYHHERFDGKGYPKKLRGKNIPLYARIICVADSLDAMNSDRCYRPHLTPEVIKKELKSNSGLQFDPEIVEYALELIEDGVIKLAGEE